MKKSLWLLPIALALPTLGVIPQFWETRTYDEFRQGDLNGLSVTGDGQLMLAPSFDLVFDTPDPIIFSAVTDLEGNVYLGTGHDGKVYKVDDGGTGSVLADLAELDVLALASATTIPCLRRRLPMGESIGSRRMGTPTCSLNPRHATYGQWFLIDKGGCWWPPATAA